MTTATKPLYKRIALVFDFDDTLAPDSYRSLVESFGVDYTALMQERVQPLLDADWDDILAKFYCLIEESRLRDDLKITNDYLENVGRNIRLFDGVPEMFDRVRNVAHNLLPDVEVNFYLLSSGILEIARGTPIANEFKALWGCEFHFDDNGEIAFIKQIITHPEKVRYLLKLSKGVNHSGEKGHPADVYRDVPQDELYIPLNQMIYIGDGSSDMPAFGLLNEHGGIAFGVFKANTAQEWSGYDSMHAGRRVENLAPVDYSEDGELMRSITLAVESICKQIALRQLSQGE